MLDSMYIKAAYARRTGGRRICGETARGTRLDRRRAGAGGSGDALRLPCVCAETTLRLELEPGPLVRGGGVAPPTVLPMVLVAALGGVSDVGPGSVMVGPDSGDASGGEEAQGREGEPGLELWVCPHACA